ncbi:MAG: hypothetical protein L6V93_13855 [Clostridiales bacterium]|nr:MAG: hypothetical protein L6V93_13855 [Clostridiales bacterium]
MPRRDKPIQKNELRFIYQMAASPVYGEKSAKKSKDFNLIYDRYAHKLAVVFAVRRQRAPTACVPVHFSGFWITSSGRKKKKIANSA